jgi:hypothetical protein
MLLSLHEKLRFACTCHSQLRCVHGLPQDSPPGQCVLVEMHCPVNPNFTGKQLASMAELVDTIRAHMMQWRAQAPWACLHLHFDSGYALINQTRCGLSERHALVCASMQGPCCESTESWQACKPANTHASVVALQVCRVPGARRGRSLLCPSSGAGSGIDPRKPGLKGRVVLGRTP